MHKKLTFSFSTLILAVVSLLAVPAFGDTISLNLDNPVQNGLPGSTVSFNAVVSTPASNGAAVFLNGDSITLDSPLAVDDSSFFNNFPLSLNPNGLFSGLLFTVSLPSNITAGIYKGTFDLIGGANGDAQNLLAVVAFNVNVPGSSPVPEPGTDLLLSTGLAGLGALVRRRSASPGNKS